MMMRSLAFLWVLILYLHDGGDAKEFSYGHSEDGSTRNENNLIALQSPSTNKQYEKRQAEQTDLVSKQDLDICTRVGNAVCSQKCRNEIGGYSCECLPGYKLAEDLITCLDINECKQFNGGCSDFCLNTPGSRTCACMDGLTLTANGRTCIDIDECNLRTFSPNCKEGTVCVNFYGSHKCMKYIVKPPKAPILVNRGVFIVMIFWLGLLTIIYSICVVFRCIEIGNLDWLDPRKWCLILLCQSADDDSGGPTMCMMCMFKNYLATDENGNKTPVRHLTAGQCCAQCCARCWFGKAYDKEDSPWQRVKKRVGKKEKRRQDRQARRPPRASMEELRGYQAYPAADEDSEAGTKKRKRRSAHGKEEGSKRHSAHAPAEVHASHTPGNPADGTRRGKYPGYAAYGEIASPSPVGPGDTVRNAQRYMESPSVRL